MIEQGRQDPAAHLCEAIEKELGKFRRLADAFLTAPREVQPAVEIEEMAARIARAIAPLVGATEGAASRAA